MTMQFLFVCYGHNTFCTFFTAPLLQSADFDNPLQAHSEIRQIMEALLTLTKYTSTNNTAVLNTKQESHRLLCA